MFLLLLLKDSKRSSSAGFTLLELLIVIVITGILSVIALPTLLSQRTKAQETEGKAYIGSMNRGQQAYYLVNRRFSSSLPELDLGIPLQTNLYEYGISVDGVLVTNKAQPRTPALRSYVGVVASSRTNLGAILCRSTEKGNHEIGNGVLNGQLVTCPKGPPAYESLQ